MSTNDESDTKRLKQDVKTHRQPPASEKAADNPPTLAAEALDTGAEITRFLIQDGVLTEQQLAYAKRIKSKLSSPRPLLSILNELGYVSIQQQRTTLRKNRVSVRIGALLVELGYLREADLRAALALQKGSAKGKKLGDILLENHFIEEHKLIEALADQLGFPNVEPEFSSIDRKLLEKAYPGWYRRCNLVPIRIENNQVLIAFADPLDQRIRREAEQVFGVNITPLIASRRSIHEAIGAFER